MGVPVHGNSPKLIGHVLEGARLQGFVCDGVPVPGAAVIYLMVAGVWHRLAMDHGTVHWHQEDKEPKTWSIAEEAWEYPVRELPGAQDLLGVTISSFVISGDGDVASVEVSFENGRSLLFSGKGDENAAHAV
jgi:hypothetical protein